MASFQQRKRERGKGPSELWNRAAGSPCHSGRAYVVYVVQNGRVRSKENNGLSVSELSVTFDSSRKNRPVGLAAGLDVRPQPKVRTVSTNQRTHTPDEPDVRELSDEPHRSGSVHCTGSYLRFVMFQKEKERQDAKNE